MVAPWKPNHTGPIIEKQPRMIRQGCLSCLGYSEAKDEPQKFLRALFFEQGASISGDEAGALRRNLKGIIPMCGFCQERMKTVTRKRKLRMKGHQPFSST